jgi:hypothetical protein
LRVRDPMIRVGVPFAHCLVNLGNSFIIAVHTFSATPTLAGVRFEPV